jgi:hypothetical protein
MFELAYETLKTRQHEKPIPKGVGFIIENRKLSQTFLHARKHPIIDRLEKAGIKYAGKTPRLYDVYYKNFR